MYLTTVVVTNDRDSRWACLICLFRIAKGLTPIFICVHMISTTPLLHPRCIVGHFSGNNTPIMVLQQSLGQVKRSGRYDNLLSINLPCSMIHESRALISSLGLTRWRIRWMYVGCMVYEARVMVHRVRLLLGNSFGTFMWVGNERQFLIVENFEDVEKRMENKQAGGSYIHSSTYLCRSTGDVGVSRTDQDCIALTIPVQSPKTKNSK